jgi:outer membrane receptor protein involved in Fe transport
MFKDHVLNLAALIFPGIAFGAQLSMDDLVSMDLEFLLNVEVSVASKRDQKVSEAPGTIVVIDKKEIRRYGAQTLRDILNRQANLQIIGSNLYPENRITMRGVMQTHIDNNVLIMLNGRPMLGPIAGGINLDLYRAFPVASIERIELIRGSGSTLYGTNAFSGVLNIVTQLSEESKISIDSMAGSDNYSSNQVGLVLKDKIVEVSSFINLIDVDGDAISGITDEQGTIDDYNLGYDGYSGTLQMSLGNLSLNILRSSTTHEHHRSEFLMPTDLLEHEREFIDFGYERQINQNWRAGFNVSRNSIDVMFNINRAVRAASSPGSTTMYETTHNFQVNDVINFLLGATYTILDGAIVTQTPIGNRTLEYDFSRKNAYTQIDYLFSNNVRAVIGLQYNNPEESAADYSPRLSLIYNNKRENKDHVYKLQCADAFRSPFAIDLFISNPELVGNPSLKPEKIRTCDAQWIAYAQDHTSSVTLYNMKQKDIHTRIGTAPATFINAGEVTFRGVELETKWKFSDSWELIGNLSYQRNEDERGVRQTTYVAEKSLKFGVSHYRNNVSASVFNSYISAAADLVELNASTPAVNPSADSFNLMTAQVEYSLNWFDAIDAMSLTFYIDNLLDENIFFPSVNRPGANTLPAYGGRAFYAGLRLEL